LFIKKAFVLCSGCPESRIDSSRVKNFLIENNWLITDKVEEADLVLFRACGLTNADIDDSVQFIEDLKSQMNDNAKLIVWGCLPKINMDALRTVYKGITFGENEINVLDKILRAKKPIAEITGNSCMPVIDSRPCGLTGRMGKFLSKKGHKVSISDDSIFQIKACTGCLGSCSFCSVRKSRGMVKSKTVDEIVAEFHDGLDKGFRYFGLLGTDLGCLWERFGN
jgi:tRNA A37 methylthiotransferase MiaB